MHVLQNQINGLRKKIYPMHVKDRLADEGRKARMVVEFRAQFMEDMMLWDLLGGQTKGFYIECGAFDGKYYSVSWVFDAMGWDGLCVEAIPQRYQECVVNRPHARVVHSALSRRGAAKTVEFAVTDDRFGGMLSFVDEAGRHKEEIANEGFTTSKVTVPCTTMDELLAGHSGPIDFASIDVEGHEAALLDGFDLKRYRPRVLMLEDNERGADPALGRYMAEQPYIQVMWLGENRVYVHKDEAAVLAAAGFGGR